MKERDQACGSSSPVALAYYDPATHSLKMSQRSLFEDSTLSSLTLPRWGTMRNGRLYALPMLALLTVAPACSSWPTPVAAQAIQGQNELDGKRGQTLVGAARGQPWPTPTLHGNHNRKGASKDSGDGLSTAIKQWPTPKTVDSKSGGQAERQRRTPRLASQTKHWPTPQASDGAKGGPNMKHGSGDQPLPSAAASSSPSPDQPSGTIATMSGAVMEHSGQLNPEFVCWLMGFPDGWLS